MRVHAFMHMSKPGVDTRCVWDRVSNWTWYSSIASKQVLETCLPACLPYSRAVVTDIWHQSHACLPYSAAVVTDIWYHAQLFSMGPGDLNSQQGLYSPSRCPAPLCFSIGNCQCRIWVSKPDGLLVGWLCFTACTVRTLRSLYLERRLCVSGVSLDGEFSFPGNRHFLTNVKERKWRWFYLKLLASFAFM